MNIGIIDADLLDNGTRHPNLALMKISGYYKSSGHNVELITDYIMAYNYDQVYISKVFSFTKLPDWLLELPNVTFGGTGFFEDGGEPLADEIEHHMPDYYLYDKYVNEQINKGRDRQRYSDYLDYSIGFATRGCFRKCEFCVNKKYDNAFLHSPISEFVNPDRPYIYLWDDNFLAYHGWETILNELEATKKPFQFRQGLDIRLMTDLKAKRLANTRYHGDFIFAFDHIEEKELIEQKLRLWKRYCSKTTKLYVLCAYKSQDELDIIDTFERIKILMKYGCLPYIMRYEEYRNSEYRILYTQIARWCNQPQFYKKKSFREFCEANQYYHKNQSTTCSAYQSMIDFERKHPKIAAKYFDLKFEVVNEYSLSFGYERKYAHKPDCDECKQEQKTWDDAYNGVYNIEKLLSQYLAKEIDLQCLSYRDIKCEILKENIAEWFCKYLLNISISDIINILLTTENLDIIRPSNIPQFSKINDAIYRIIDILYKSDENHTFESLGYYIEGKWKNEIARRKYGENHSKFASLLDLAIITSQNNVKHISLSVLGQAYIKLSSINKELLISKLLFRIPIVQQIFINASKSEIRISDYMHGLSDQTIIRRLPNIRTIIDFIHKHTQGLDYVFNNIKE